MPIDIWTAAQTELNELLSILLADKHYAVVEDPSLEYDENVERLPSPEEPIVKVRGSIISYVDRLDDEFTRSLQNIDPHGTEYVDRLKDEKPLYEMICRAQAHFERNDQASLARVMMRRLEHIYSKVCL
jgi:translation initiation factor 3 subunit C